MTAFLVQFRADGAASYQTEYAAIVSKDVIRLLDVRLPEGTLLELRLPNRTTGELRPTTARVLRAMSEGVELQLQEPDPSVQQVVEQASSSELPTEDLLYAGGSTEDLIVPQAQGLGTKLPGGGE